MFQVPVVPHGDMRTGVVALSARKVEKIRGLWCTLFCAACTIFCAKQGGKNDVFSGMLLK
jgi:hypothetical protein